MKNKEQIQVCLFILGFIWGFVGALISGAEIPAKNVPQKIFVILLYGPFIWCIMILDFIYKALGKLSK